jgi:hypothetical protein
MFRVNMIIGCLATDAWQLQRQFCQHIRLRALSVSEGETLRSTDRLEKIQ